MFDQMYDCVKLHNTACMMAADPVVIHAVLMSIIFEHYKQLTKIDGSKNKQTESSMKIKVLGVCSSTCEASYSTGARISHGSSKTVGEQVHLLDLSQNCQFHILQKRPVSK